MTIDYAHARELMVDSRSVPGTCWTSSVLDVLARACRGLGRRRASGAALADVELPLATAAR